MRTGLWKYCLATILFSISVTQYAYASNGCLNSDPMPDGPTLGSQTATLTIPNQYTALFWRQVCPTNTATPARMFVRITPIAGAPLVCGTVFYAIQDGWQYRIALLATGSASTSFCQSLLVATSFKLAQYVGDVDYDNRAAFTLVTTDGSYAVDFPAEPGAPLIAVEYYHAAFDHYFVTASPDEIAKLDAGTFAGWARTGLSFRVWPATGAPVGTFPVCRFFSTSFAPKSSHFYSAFGSECDGLLGDRNWQLEGYVFNVVVPAGDGSCPTGYVPVYRYYNNGQGGAPNHRFNTDLGLWPEMKSRGWVPEGFGSYGVSMCAPA